jgi:hypothetical protein
VTDRAGNAIAAPQPSYAEAYNFGVIETVTVTSTVYGEYLCPEPTLCPACPESSFSPTTSSILVTSPTAVVSTSSAAPSSTVPSSTPSSSAPQSSSDPPSTSSTVQSSTAPTSAPSSSGPVYCVPTPVSSNAGVAPSTSSSVPAQTPSQPSSTPSCLPQAPDCSSLAVKIPDCATACFEAAVPKVGCGLTDYACQCSAANVRTLSADLTPCVIGACPAEEIQAVVNGANAGSYSRLPFYQLQCLTAVARRFSSPRYF